MTTYDIIPDIHGQSAKLDAALAGLGWRRGSVGWSPPDPDRQIVFLGDFIDRGPDNRAVLKTVRDLVGAGKAKAIMGNHELNALQFHSLHPDDGQPLRAHTPKNIRQHQTFLDQFPPGNPQTRDVIGWMRSLPLFVEEDGFRAVHACWAEQITKGPEHRLPDGWSFTDKDGTMRDHLRLQWWNAAAQSWRDIAISVPSIEDLPDEELPETVSAQTYAATARPVFFGHYWL